MIHEELMTKNHTVRQRPGIIASDMNGEIVLFSVDNGKYYNLGDSGGAIWGLIKEPIFISALIENLASKYDVPLDRCESETLSFLAQLYKEELIQCSF